MKKYAWLALALCMLMTCALAEAADWTGEWAISHVEMEGETFGPEALSDQWLIQLRADQTAAFTMSGIANPGTWRLEKDQLVLDCTGFHFTFVLTDTGFYMDQGGAKIYFARTASSPAPQAVAEGPAGAWNLTAVETAGYKMDPAMMGMKMTFMLFEDGSLTGEVLGAKWEGTWEVKDDLLVLEDGKQPMECILEGDTFTYEMEAGKAIFTRTGAATQMTVTDAALPEAFAQGEATVTAITAENVIGAWEFAQMEMGGLVMPASSTGIYWLIDLNADGTVQDDTNGEKSKGTWHLDGNQLNVSTGNGTYAFTVEPDSFHVTMDSVKMIFNRRGAK